MPAADPPPSTTFPSLTSHLDVPTEHPSRNPERTSFVWEGETEGKRDSIGPREMSALPGIGSRRRQSPGSGGCRADGHPAGLAQALLLCSTGGPPLANRSTSRHHDAQVDVNRRQTRDVDTSGRVARRCQNGVEMKPTRTGSSMADQLVNLFARLFGREERLAPVPVPVRTKPSSPLPIRVEHR